MYWSMWTLIRATVRLSWSRTSQRSRLSSPAEIQREIMVVNKRQILTTSLAETGTMLVVGISPTSIT